jgi:two-component system phosphate regulon sensor histidine kinase PhoR
MSIRRSLKLPITLGVVMIVLVVVLIVGWVLLTAWPAVNTEGQREFYWALLAVGSTFLLMVLVGVVVYLTLSVKAINLNRRQSNFIDSVTHELKSPIASLKLYLQTLSRRQVSAEEQTDFCRFMLDDVARLERLINHMLEAARLEHGDIARPTETIELAPLIADCADVVCKRYRISRETVKIDNAQLGDAPCGVRADRHDLELVFRNLIDNAVKYAGEPAAVEVVLKRIEKNGGKNAESKRTAKSRDRVQVSVIDNGRGIPQALRRKIFGRFVRLGLELERTKPGTGLGLYIVRTIVRQLRGDVRIRDRENESGTIFEVELPLSDVPASDSSVNAMHAKTTRSDAPPLETARP